MAKNFKFSIFLCLYVFIFTKDLHAKSNLETKDKIRYGKSFVNLFSNDESYIYQNGRSARHTKTVTESVLDHLMHEIKQEYYSTHYNANSPIQRLIRNLSKELKRNDKTKLLKEIEKRKNINNKKNDKATRGLKKHRRTTTKFMY